MRIVYRLAPVQNVCKPKKENIYPLTIPLSANRNLCFAESWLTGRHEFSPRTYASSRSFSRRNLTRVNVSTVRLEAGPIQYLPCAYLATVNIPINTYKVTRRISLYRIPPLHMHNIIIVCIPNIKSSPLTPNIKNKIYHRTSPNT